MKGKQILVGSVIVAFGAYSAIPLYEYGYLGFLRLALSNSATIQVALDLTIALTLVLVWLWRDARQRGMSPLPFLLLTLFVGSFGPLFYLWRRFGREKSSSFPLEPSIRSE